MIVSAVPVKVGLETVPDGVPDTVTVPDVPANVPAMYLVVTLSDGFVEVYEASPVFTVVLPPFVGSVPWEKPRVKVSLATVAVNTGSVPTSVIELTVVVEPGVDTLIEPAELTETLCTNPARPVAVEDSTDKDTEPLGWKEPVEERAFPENVG